MYLLLCNTYTFYKSLFIILVISIEPINHSINLNKLFNVKNTNKQQCI